MERCWQRDQTDVYICSTGEFSTSLHSFIYLSSLRTKLSLFPHTLQPWEVPNNLEYPLLVCKLLGTAYTTGSWRVAQIAAPFVVLPYLPKLSGWLR